MATTTNPHDTATLIRNMSSRSKSEPCQCVNCALGRSKIGAKENLAGDLASQMFGHVVPTEVARQILTTFVLDGFVQVYEGEVNHTDWPPNALDPRSEEVQHVLEQAFKDAKAHDCIRVHAQDQPSEESMPPTDQEGQQEKIYSFRWRLYPQTPFTHDVVGFFNEVTDRALAAAKPHLLATTLKVRHRFAVPSDRRYQPPLYNPDQESIRLPEFFLLPIQAFSGDRFKTVDKRYHNFSAARLVGEYNDNLAEGLEQMQWYAQGLKYAQPWIIYVLSMTFSRPEEMLALSRIDASDWEHVMLMLWDGRGSLEFIRILVGLAIADDVVLGQNPAVQLMYQVHAFKLEPEPKAASCVSDSVLYERHRSKDAMSVRSASPESSYESASDGSYEDADENEDHMEVEMKDVNEEDPQSKKRETRRCNSTE